MKWKWYAVDDDFAKDVAYLDTVNEGTLGIHVKSNDNQWWIVSYVSGHRTQQWYLYNREQRQVQFLFSRQEPLEAYGLAKLASGRDQIPRRSRPDQLPDIATRVRTATKTVAPTTPRAPGARRARRAHL